MNNSGTISRRLGVALAVTLLFVVGETAAGFYANSLALLSDAAHNFTDVLALALSWYALYLSSRPSNPARTYGYHRAGILAALFNAATLLILAGVILYEAYQRLVEPPQIQEQVMIAVATVGFVANSGIAIALKHYSETDLNVRSAFVHMLGDAVATVGVILAGIVIALTGWTALDPLASILIAVIIAWSSWGILQEGLNIVLEASPRGIDVDALARDILQVEGVHGVHDLHAWSITSQMHALSAHVLTDNVPISRGGRKSSEILMPSW